MKTVIYIIIGFLFTWVLLEPSENYKAIELPESKLYQNVKLPIENLEIDSVISDIEKNIIYLKNVNYNEISQ